MATGGDAESNFPIHWHVWHNDYRQLESLLKTKQHDTEKLDPRGRTPVHLAVVLGHLESAKVLLQHNANANAENLKYWPVVHEAVATGDPELVQLCLQHRDYQRYTTRTEGVPALLQRLKEAPDFYVEMKWEFTSWVPLVSRVCPSDTYKVWKSGSNVRIDTTLLGFDNMHWQRGSRSFVFKGQENAATTMEIDHDSHRVYSETIQMQPVPPDMSFLAPTEDQVAARLTAPIVTTYIDTEKICFERSKSGIWGWRTEKTENVNSYDCKVFSASNVELVTKTRTEHMTDVDKKQMKKSNGNKNPIESFLGMAEKEEFKAQGPTANGDISNISYNPCSITPEEYFDASIDLKERDIGRPLEQTTKVQKFKAQLWLCENYPLSLPEQVIPIIDLMAVSNAHFRKLKDFITLQLPAGFPVKIEIPLFHVLNARITFGNIFALNKPVEGVQCVGDFAEAGEMAKCVVEPAMFEAPNDYSVIGSLGDHAPRLRDEDDEILQFAIRQSLVESGTEDEQVTFWEALHKDKPNSNSLPAKYLQSEEERQLQRALEESMMLSQGKPLPELPATTPPAVESENTTPQTRSNHVAPPPTLDSDLQLALEMSRQQVQDDTERRRKQEEEEFERILQLSMTEK